MNPCETAKFLQQTRWSMTGQGEGGGGVGAGKHNSLNSLAIVCVLSPSMAIGSLCKVNIIYIVLFFLIFSQFFATHIVLNVAGVTYLILAPVIANSRTNSFPYVFKSLFSYPI